MSYKRGTTPTHVFETDIDLTAASIYITYKQDNRTVVEKHGSDITVVSTVSSGVTTCTMTIAMTQEETLAFKAGDVEIQVRYVLPDGTADASEIIRTRAERILKDGVIV